MNVKLLAIGVAKHVFQLYGVDARGKVGLKKKLKRGKVLSFMATLSRCTIVMEACGA